MFSYLTTVLGRYNVPNKKKNNRASPFAPEPSQGQQTAPQGEVVSAEPSITDKQGKMLFAICRSANLSDQDVKDALAGIGLKCHRDEIPKSRFQDVLKAVDPQFKFHSAK